MGASASLLLVFASRARRHAVARTPRRSAKGARCLPAVPPLSAVLPKGARCLPRRQRRLLADVYQAACPPTAGAMVPFRRVPLILGVTQLLHRRCASVPCSLHASRVAPFDLGSICHDLHVRCCPSTLSALPHNSPVSDSVLHLKLLLPDMMHRVWRLVLCFESLLRRATPSDRGTCVQVKRQIHTNKLTKKRSTLHAADEI
jgi:hypothetical protein